MKKRDQKYIHIPSGLTVRYFKKVRGSSTHIEVLVLGGGGFTTVALHELKEMKS